MVGSSQLLFLSLTQYHSVLEALYHMDFAHEDLIIPSTDFLSS